MLYVKAVDSKGNIMVADTDDNSVDAISNRELTKLLKKKVIHVYGAFVYNDKVETNCLFYPVSYNAYDLKRLVEVHRERHNPWSLKPIEDYLATLNINTVIKVDYVYSGDEDRGRHKSRTILKKIDSDKWLYEDTNNTFSGEKGDSKFAAHMIDVACCFSVQYSLV